MNYLIDGIILLIIVFTVWRSAKYGFIRTTLELVGFVAAIFLAAVLSNFVAITIFDTFISPSLTNSITQSITSAAGSVLDSVTSTLPSFIINGADTLNLSISNQISVSSAETAANIVTNIARPVVVMLIEGILLVVIFFALMFIVKFFAKSINKLFNLPIVGGVNRVLGGAIGVFKGAICAVIFVAIITLMVSLTKNGFLIFTPNNINGTYIFKSIASILPF